MIRYLELDKQSELHKRPQSRKDQLKSLPPLSAQATLGILLGHQRFPQLGAQIYKHVLIGPFCEALTLACAQV